MSIVQFFSTLSERMNKENNLSDITWALCKTDPEFKNTFLKFCFNEDFSKESFELVREYTNEDSRPDFYFVCSRGKYLLEVKIYDTEDHFIKYDKTFKDCTKAIIANYKMNSDSGYITSEWKEYYELLGCNIEDKPMITGYREYLKNVIHYVEIKKMNLDNIRSLMDFNNAIIDILNSTSPSKCSISNRFKSHSENYSGQYFEYKINNKQFIYPWFGYDFRYPGIWIVFEESLCKGTVEKIKSLEEGKFYNIVERTIGEKDVWVKFKDDLLEQFNNNKTGVDDQKKMLSEFFCEVMSLLQK